MTSRAGDQQDSTDVWLSWWLWSLCWSPPPASLGESDQGDKMNYCLLIISLELGATNWLDRIIKMKRKAGELKIPPLALCVLYYKAETHLVRLRALGTAILPISPHFIIQRLELATWISIFWLKEDSPWIISQIGLPRTWENIQFPQSQHELWEMCWNFCLMLSSTTTELLTLFWLILC